MDNQYDKTGAVKKSIYLANQTKASISSDGETMKLYLANDTGEAIIKDHDEVLRVGVHLKSIPPATMQNGSIAINGAYYGRAIQFDAAAEPLETAEGLLQWNDTDGTLDLGMHGGEIIQQVGQELFVKVRNDEESTIENGKVVYISGRTGLFPDVKLARSDAEATSEVLGIATHDIAATGDKFGYVTTMGYVRGIKTNYTGTGVWGTTWVAGDRLWLSKTDAGVLTNVEPAVPHHSDSVGRVGIIGAAQGSILVMINRHKTLEELSDVDGTALTTTGQFPSWNQTTGYFDFDKNISNYAATVHVHSKLVASDGSPDPAAWCDSVGNFACTLAITGHGGGAMGSVTHSTRWSSTGHQTMVGDARPYRDELGDIFQLQQSGTGVSSNLGEGTVDFASNATYNATFNLADALVKNTQLNHDRDLSTPIMPHIHWVQEKNYSPNFLLEYRWQINGGALTTAWTKLKCNSLVFTYVSGSLHQISYAAPITPPVGTALSDIVQFRVYRDTTNASGEFAGSDPYNTGGNATTRLMAFDTHIQQNSLGSDQEYVK